MSIFAKHFQALRSKGYSVIPVCPASKIPAISRWSDFCDSSPTQEQSEAWAKERSEVGIGLCCGPASGVVAVDIDLHLDNPVDRTLYDKICNLLPLTPAEKYGAKGITKFYRYSGQVTQVIKLGQRPGVEILSRGRFTVLPPSIHPDTSEPYRWVGEQPLCDLTSSQLPELTQETIAAIQSVITASQMPSKFSTGRNDALKGQVVAALKRGKDTATIVEEIVKYDERHHEPPLFVDEKEEQMRGNDSSENARRFVESIRTSIEKDHTEGVAGLALVSLTELYNKPERETNWLVDELLPTDGISLLAAKPKTGKSTIARQLAAAVADGRSFLGRKVAAPGLVYYIAPEEKESEVRRHFKDIGVSTTGNIKVVTALPSGDRLQALKNSFGELPPALVIVDTLFRFFNIADGNNYSGVTAVLGSICDLARSSGSHILLIHHCGKGERTGSEAILGSTAIFGTVDTAITMHNSDGRRTIKTEQRYGRSLEEVVLDFDGTRRILSAGKTRSEIDHEDYGRKIKEALLKMGHAVTEAELETVVGGKTKTFRRVLRTLAHAATGDVLRTGSGKRNDPYKYSFQKSDVETVVPNEVREKAA